jgi:hypothetical protein
MTPAQSLTDSTGLAAARWSLGPRVDSAQTARATFAGFPPVLFTAHAITSGAALELARRTVERQFGEAGTVLAESLGVALRLPDGRPVWGAMVTWTAQAGAGTLTPAVSRTDAQGNAAAVWRLGAPLGEVQAAATVDGWTVGFSAFARAGAPARLEKVSGGGETGPIGHRLRDSLVVRVTDAFGYPVPGSNVRWTAVSGRGSLIPDIGTTDPQGIARTLWFPGPLVDSVQMAHASIAGLAPVSFFTTAVTDGTDLELNLRGDGQRGPVGSVLADSLGVVVTFAGRPVQNALVTWAVAYGGGEVTPAQSRTDAQGRAFAAWRLGTSAGPAQVTVAIYRVTVRFSATQEAAPPP